MKYDTLVVGMLAPLFAIIGVIIGSFLSHKSAQDLFMLQKRYEMRVTGYAEVVGLRVALGQTMNTLLEAKILSEYYDFRFQRFSHAQFDLDLAQAENKRMLGLIGDFSKLQRELFKALAAVSLSYPKSDELSNAIAELYHLQAVDVTPPKPEVVNSSDLLDQWKVAAIAQKNAILKENLADKMNRLIDILEKHTAE